MGLLIKAFETFCYALPVSVVLGFLIKGIGLLQGRLHRSRRDSRAA